MLSTFAIFLSAEEAHFDKAAAASVWEEKQGASRELQFNYFHNFKTGWWRKYCLTLKKSAYFLFLHRLFKSYFLI